jgi:radical SAM superfamily enzyme YgiQ (UPF0313 family)
VPEIFFGAESGSQKVLDAMNKGAVPQNTAQPTCHKLGIQTALHDGGVPERGDGRPQDVGEDAA